MKRIFLALLLAVSTCMAVNVANASPLPVIPLGTGDITFHWVNYENRVTGLNQTLSGIFRLDQITDSNGNTLWNNGDLGVELTGVFSGLQVTSYGGESKGSQVLFSGGELKVYEGSKNTFDPTKPSTASTGTLWLDANFVTGVDASNPNATLVSTIDQLMSTAPVGHNLMCIKGTGTADLDVVGGLNYVVAALDSNTFERLDGSGLYADLQMNNTFYILNAGVAPYNHTYGGYDVYSSDPVGAYATPEPGTICLLGAGLLGLGIFGRKRMRG